MVTGLRKRSSGEGREPRRDVEHRASGPGRHDHHHRGLHYYYDNKKTYPKTLDAEIKANIAKIEKVMGKKFGDLDNPLLLSVRSGARESMPGMMDTVLNLGINDTVVEALAKKTGNAEVRLGQLPSLPADVRFGGDGGRSPRRRAPRSLRGHPRQGEEAKAKVADDSGLEEATCAG